MGKVREIDAIGISGEEVRSVDARINLGGLAGWRDCDVASIGPRQRKRMYKDQVLLIAYTSAVVEGLGKEGSTPL